jgi:Flp pilus assembly pilin Flp
MSLIQQLWEDECGALVAAEYVLVGTMLTIGITAGVRVVQAALLANLQDLADVFN